MTIKLGTLKNGLWYEPTGRGRLEVVVTHEAAFRLRVDLCKGTHFGLDLGS